MKYLNTLIAIISLMFALPVWSEEDWYIGLEWEKISRLAIYSCRNESTNFDQKVFTYFRYGIQDYIFNEEFGRNSLLKLDRQYVLNLPNEATMLIFESDFQGVSGLVSGKAYEAICLDIGQHVFLHSEFLSKGLVNSMFIQTKEFQDKLTNNESLILDYKLEIVKLSKNLASQRLQNKDLKKNLTVVEAQLSSNVLNQQAVELRNQVATLQKQLGSLQDLLDAAAEEASDTNVQLLTFGSNLNIALAKLAQKEKEKAKIEKAKAEVEKAKANSERAKAKLEIYNAKLLQEKSTKLENFKSEFFGEIRKLLEKQEGVKISGDRFVFSSEILFSSGEAVLSEGGKKQIKQIANLILSISDKIPSNIDWILRVDGHTDDKKIRGGKYKNNWELSQARALSVVLYMQEFLNVPAYRLAATGFGEYQPVNKDNSEKAREENRRIEIKLTER